MNIDQATRETAVGVDHLLCMQYTNYRGERMMRQVVPQRMWFGVTDWHPEAQWFLDAYDVDRHAIRSFAVRDITGFTDDTVGRVSH